MVHNFSTLMDKWMKEKKLTVRKSTYSNYNQYIRNHITPQFGEKKISEISRDDILDFIRILSELDLKGKTIIHICKPLSQFFKWLMEEKLLDKNPYTRIKMPKDYKVEKIEIFTPQELTMLVKNCMPYQRDMILLAFDTGMRSGEVISLMWEDLNLEDNTVHVCRTLSYYKNKSDYVICAPKTKASDRKIELCQATVDMLRRRKRDAKGSKYVFENKHGQIYSRQAVNLKRSCTKSGIKYRSFHTLRHTNISYQLSRGVPIPIVQRRAGHSSAQITCDIYSHFIPDEQKLAVDVMSPLVGELINFGEPVKLLFPYDIATNIPNQPLEYPSISM